MSTRFIEGRISAGGAHPTSGLSGFPARDYMAAGGSDVFAPYDAVVPSVRPIGWASTQNPAAGFGGQRVYLMDSRGYEGYFAHLGTLSVQSGQRVQQGQKIGTVWRWPNDPGRSHIHFGYEKGDPLVTAVRSDGSFVQKDGAGPTPPKPKFPRPRMTKTAGRGWTVSVGDKVLLAHRPYKEALKRQLAALKAWKKKRGK